MLREIPVQWFCHGISAALAMLMFAFNDQSTNGADGETKLRIRVVDTVDSQLIPCRIHLFDAAKKPVRPPGLPFWKDQFVCDGLVEMTVEPGMYFVEVESGPEVERFDTSVDVKQGQTHKLGVSLSRAVNLNVEGWHCGDLHVHRPAEEMPALMRAERLDIAPVITWWNQKNLWGDKPLPDNPLVTIDGGRFYNTMAGEDEREGGAILFFGLKTPLPITQATREYPSPMKFIEMAREQNAHAWIDIEKPFWWDVPVWLALGKVDSIGIANNHMCRSSMYENEAWGKPRDAKRLPAPRGNGYWSQEIYYHILNAGLRVPPSAGSASGVLPNPVGYNRVYVYTGTETLKDSESLWWDGLKAGRSFVTNGPLLRVFAEGHPPGHVFKAAPGKPLTISFEARLFTQDHIDKVEIIQNGNVVKRIPAIGVSQTRNLGAFEVKEGGWFLVRAISDNRRTFRFASTAPFYVEVGEKQRISRKSAQFFLDWVNERAERVKTKLTDPEQLREVMAYHNRAREFWQKRVADANAE